MMLFALFWPVSLDHDSRSGIARQPFLRFRKLREFLNAKDHLYQINKAVPVPQVVLAVGMATLGSALTGVADLKAAPEVDNKNLF